MASNDRLVSAELFKELAESVNRFLLGHQALVFCALVGGMLFYASEQSKFDVVTEHRIEVLRKVGANRWLMHSDEQGDFLYTGCDDFPNDSVIWEGYLANRARWEERGACKSIRRNGLGFWWERDEEGNAKEIDNARRTARQGNYP